MLGDLGAEMGPGPGPCVRSLYKKVDWNLTKLMSTCKVNDRVIKIGVNL